MGSRQTTSPLPSYEEALAQLLAIVPSSTARTASTPLEACANRVLHEDIKADRDLPPFNRATMDGYALRAADYAKDKAFPVVGEIPAGASPNVQVPPGACVKIATGAAVPDSLDTVIQHEFSDRANPVTFTVDSIAPGHAVHPRGADAKQGDIVIARGTRLSAHHLGIAAAVGCSTLPVVQPPRVMILTSGDEVKPIDAALEPHQIRNSNGPMLSHLLTRFGAGEVQHEHLLDEKDATIDAVARAIVSFDLIISVGGISAGERDYFPIALEDANVEMSLSGARIQPGKPIHAGRAPNGSIVIGLPGNPVSALVCAHLFVWPAIRRMSGVTSPMPWRTVTLAESVKPNANRQAFRPAILHEDGDHATVPTWAGSGDLVHTASTHGFIALPVQGESVEAGTRLRFLPWA